MAKKLMTAKAITAALSRCKFNPALKSNGTLKVLCDVEKTIYYLTQASLRNRAAMDEHELLTTLAADTSRDRSLDIEASLDDFEKAVIDAIRCLTLALINERDKNGKTSVPKTAS